MKFDEKLQNLRKASSLSQEQLASLLGVSRQAVSKWESGTSYPEMDKLIELTKIFKCSMDDLVNESTSDKTIMKDKNNKRYNYLDSLLKFIIKSVNMFCSMKFSSIVKCFVELFFIGLFLVLIMVLVNQVLNSIIRSIFSLNGSIIIEIIIAFFYIAIHLVLISISIIIFIQVYKVRYLDYYDVLIYKYDQENELNDIEMKNDNKRIKLSSEKREHIIIRDPNHRPFAFLSIISKFILSIIKAFVLCFSVIFIFSFIFLVISLVISVYLLFKNFIFFGIMLGIIGLILCNVLLLYLVYAFIANKSISFKYIFIIFLSSIFISSIGAGLSIIKLKDFNFINDLSGLDYLETISESYSYNDDLYIDLSGYDANILYKIDNSLEDVKVSIEYSKITSKVSLLRNDNDINIDYLYTGLNFSKFINIVLNDLENNIVRNFDDVSNLEIVIEANENNIKNLIKNVSKYKSVDIYEVNDGYSVSLSSRNPNNSVCEIKDFYYDCIGLVLIDINKQEFKYEYKDGTLIYDKNLYNCYYDEFGEAYNCHLK